MSRLLADPPRCTRRRRGYRPQQCPGVFGYCATCPEQPKPGAFMICRLCLHDVRVVDVEHANRVTGGFGCGQDGCS